MIGCMPDHILYEEVQVYMMLGLGLRRSDHHIIISSYHIIISYHNHNRTIGWMIGRRSLIECPMKNHLA